MVAAYGGDPLRLGLVTSINQPGGNITVVTTLNDQITAKRLELLWELVPKVTAIGLLVSRSLPRTEVAIAQATEAGRRFGLQIVTLDGANEREIDEAFATAIQQRLGAILVEPTALVMHQRAQLATLAARYAIPVLYPAREFAFAGGLVSYGANFTDGYRQAALYAARILKGTKPAELPVLQPTKFDLVFNVKTNPTEGTRYLAGCDGFLQVHRQEKGTCTFTRRGSVPWSIFDATAEEFEVEFVSEHDHRYWDLPLRKNGITGTNKETRRLRTNSTTTYLNIYAANRITFCRVAFG